MESPVRKDRKKQELVVEDFFNTPPKNNRDKIENTIMVIKRVPLREGHSTENKDI